MPWAARGESRFIVPGKHGKTRSCSSLHPEQVRVGEEFFPVAFQQQLFDHIGPVGHTSMFENLAVDKAPDLVFGKEIIGRSIVVITGVTGIVLDSFSHMFYG